MNTMKLVLSFKKRIMLKLWTDPNQTEFLYVDVGYYDEERLIENSKPRFHIDSDKILLSNLVNSHVRAPINNLFKGKYECFRQHD